MIVLATDNESQSWDCDSEDEMRSPIQDFQNQNWQDTLEEGCGGGVGGN